jgi:hypothetical protein
MKKRESDVCLQFKLQSKTEIERESEFFKKQKKKIKKLGLKFLSPVIVPKLRSESRV